MIDPDFPSSVTSLADLRDVEEKTQAGHIRADVEAFEAAVRQIRAINRSRFKIRRFRALPSVSLFRVDDVLFWGPYLVGQPSRNMPTLLVHRGGFLFDRLIAHFDEIWHSDQLSIPVDLTKP